MTSSVFYRLHRYFAGRGPLIPLIFIIAMIGVMYSVAPMNVTGGYVLSEVLCFCLMVFVTLSMDAASEKTEEQLLFLRAVRPVRYYLARELTFLTIGFVYSFLLAMGPVYANIANHFDFFVRPLTVYDVVSGFFLIFAGSLSGIILGDLLNGRVVKEKKAGILFTVLLAVAVIASEGICQEFPFLGFLKVVLPPVMISARIFRGADVIGILPLFGIFLHTLLLGAVYTVMKICFMNRHRFE